MKLTSQIFALLLLGFSASSQPITLFEAANEQYQATNYSEAAALYDSILQMGYPHAETYYNLGNCHYRMGQIGLAILNYERALRQNPADEDARHNLDIAQKSTVDEFNVVPTPPLTQIFTDISGVFSPNIWAILGLFFGTMAVILFAWFLFRKRNAVVGFVALTALIIGLGLTGMAWGANRINQRVFGIVTAANVYVKSAPSSQASDLYILHEGTKVRVLESFESWQKVRLPDGKTGWLPQSGVELI